MDKYASHPVAAAPPPGARAPPPRPRGGYIVLGLKSLGFHSDAALQRRRRVSIRSVRAAAVARRRSPAARWVSARRRSARVWRPRRRAETQRAAGEKIVFLLFCKTLTVYLRKKTQ